MDSKRKEAGEDSSFQFIYDGPSTVSQAFVQLFHEVPHRALGFLNFNLRTDVCSASKKDRAAILVLEPETNLIPIDGRCHCVCSMASFMGFSEEMSVVTDRAGVPLKVTPVPLSNL